MKDLRVLQVRLESMPKEDIGAKLLNHLPWWDVTCGGADFARMGMRSIPRQSRKRRPSPAFSRK
jgi:hypothetical protein